MIREKKCATCEYANAWEAHCEKIHEGITEDDCCGCWEPKHGEYISPKVARPQNGEFVILANGWQYSYREETEEFYPEDESKSKISAKDLNAWMRLPSFLDIFR